MKDVLRPARTINRIFFLAALAAYTAVIFRFGRACGKRERKETE